MKVVSSFFYFNFSMITYFFLVFPYQPSSSLIPSQNQTASTVKIFINPFFRLPATNQSNKLSSETKQQHDSSLLSRSRSESRSPSRSPPTDQPRKKPSNKKQRNPRKRKVLQTKLRQEKEPLDKKQRNRQKRKALQTKFRQEKELLNKNQALLISSSKFKHCRSSFDRWEHKEEKLNRLFKEYSNEDTVTQWKPLSLKDYSELYEHAYNKYHETSHNN